MTRHEFLNRVRSLHCIEGYELPLSHENQDAFLSNPVRFFMRCDDETADVIWNAVEARQRPIPAATTDHQLNGRMP
jgi:hypothetical protein